MANIPSFLVRTDSEKHVDFPLTHLPTAMMREMEEQSFNGQAIPDKELEAQALSSMQVCSHDDLRRRKGDMTQHGGRPGRVKRTSKSRGGGGDDGEDEDQVGT